MSKVLAKESIMVPTELGMVTVTTETIEDFDIEDIVRTRAESQAMILQALNLSRDMNPQEPDPAIVSTIYKNVKGDLENG